MTPASWSRRAGAATSSCRILRRKLAAVELKFGKSDFERRHYALLALMCIYGIELLADNIAECRANMLEILADYLNLDESDDLYRAASYVLSQNLVHGDALTMRTSDGQPITFAEWGYLGKGKFQRRDFRFDVLTQIVGLQRGGLALRPPRQARDLHADQDLPADDGERAGRARSATPEGGRMSAQASFALRGRNPDVLTCIANLSNDEVFTPPEFANRMLDTLAEAWAADNGGADIWADKTVRFLDPCTKSGVFLREITSRLTKGLADEIPDLEERVDHILTKQVFGIGITHLTSLLARRSVYCSKHANGKHSIAKSLRQRRWQHLVRAHGAHVGRMASAGTAGPARRRFDRGEGLETHAYAFIHTDDIKTRMAELFGGDMQFDVIIGNPPYQLDDGGYGTSAAPIYQLFVEQAKKLEPRYLSMVIPARWFAGGKGLDEFRESMLTDNRLRSIDDYLSASDVFPGVGLKGGVCYFLWDRDNPGPCRVTTHFKDWPVSTATSPAS